MEEYIEYLYQNRTKLDQFNWINSIEQRFIGEWREGKEMHKVVITQKFYQTVEGSSKV